MAKLTVEVEGNVVEVEGNVVTPKVKKVKLAKIVCNIDGELVTFKNEKELKQFMWNARPTNVVRYDLVGTVRVPFELTVE